jgi:hypothetical protein
VHVPFTHWPAHLSCELLGRHGVPFGAAWFVHTEPTHVDAHVVSLPQMRPFKLGMPRLEIEKHAIDPDGVAGSGRQMPWHSVSGPPSSGSHGEPYVPVWHTPRIFCLVLPTSIRSPRPTSASEHEKDAIAAPPINSVQGSKRLMVLGRADGKARTITIARAICPRKGQKAPTALYSV